MVKYLQILCLFIATTTLAATEPTRIIYQLNKNNPDHTFTATITLKNNDAHNWQLGFTSLHLISDVSDGKIINQTGGYYIIQPTGNTNTLHIKGVAAITKLTDAPSGYFLIENGKQIPLASTIILPERPTTTLTVDSQPANITLAQSLIIPLPVELQRNEGEFLLRTDTAIIVDKQTPAALDAANFFALSITPATNFHLPVVMQNIQTPPANTIVLTHQGASLNLGSEGYLLDVTDKNIIIRANDTAGFFYAIESLRQLLPPAIFSTQNVADVTWAVPALHIRDYPRFAYRGLHLDVARNFISVAEVKHLLDLMALHKLNKFQWHLSDDEGWRIEIKKYPMLTSTGAWRGYNRLLTPAEGSGAKIYGGYYTQQQIRDVVAYAQTRHITIVPEIDMPGHARALIMSLRDELIDPKDHSRYSSVQHYHDNVLSPCLESTYVVLDNIMTEIATLFPGDTIHVGSDEIPKGAWSNAPSCKTLMTASSLKNPTDLQHYFLTRMQKIIHAKNKKMAGWEEVIQHGDLDHSTTIYSWTGETAGLNAATHGYPVVMMPARYFYFDLAYNDSPTEPGVYWAGYVDTYQTYSYHPNWTASASANILGIEGALWSENINSPARLDYLAFPKLLALAEVAWTPESRRNWNNFAARMAELHLKRLDYYGVNYRIPPTGDTRF